MSPDAPVQMAKGGGFSDGSGPFVAMYEILAYDKVQ